MGLLDIFKKKTGPKAVKVTEGGSSVYKYEEKENTGYRPPVAYGKYADEVCAHFEALFPDREEVVFHEVLSDLVHIDVYIRKPNANQNFYVIYTTGMSDMPNNLPKELTKHKELLYNELFMFLPADWKFADAGRQMTREEQEDAWIINYIKFLARFPHEYNTWLAYGHTLPNGPQYAPLCDKTRMGGVVLSQTGDELGGFEAKDGNMINLLMVIPAYQEEIEYKLKYGMDGLNEVFSKNKMPMVLDLNRPNYCSDFKERLD